MEKKERDRTVQQSQERIQAASADELIGADEGQRKRN